MKKTTKTTSRKKLTPKEAIRAFCLECMGGDEEEVRRCTSRKCNLWRFRKGRKGKGK